MMMKFYLYAQSHSSVQNCSSVGRVFCGFFSFSFTFISSDEGHIFDNIVIGKSRKCDLYFFLFCFLKYNETLRGTDSLYVIWMIFT